MVKMRSFARSDELGGNMFLLEDDGSKIMLDFGEDFNRFQKFFTGALNPRKANGVEDYIELGILPDLKGVYRKDMLRHVGKVPEKEPALDGILISHAHRDHMKYLPFLRADMPVYCSEATKKVMEWLQEQRRYKGLNEFVELKKRYRFRKSKKSERKVRVLKNKSDETRRKREFNILKDGELTSIGNFDVVGKRVNHEVPGAMGFLIEGSDSRIVYTGDLRNDMNGEVKTSEFVEKAKRFDPNALITEATNAGNDKRKKDTYKDIAREIKSTESLSLVNFNETNLDLLGKVLRAAKKNGRKLAIKPSQAKLIRKFGEADILDSELSLGDRDIVSFVYQQGWGMITNHVRDTSAEWKPISMIEWKDRSLEDVLRLDYKRLSKEFFEDYDYVSPDGIKHNQENFVVFCDYPTIVNFIDFQPRRRSKFVDIKGDSSEKANYREKKTANWLTRFSVDKAKLHTPAHLLHLEIERMVKEIDAEKVVPVHTNNSEAIDCGDCQKIVPEKGKEYRL